MNWKMRIRFNLSLVFDCKEQCKNVESIGVQESYLRCSEVLVWMQEWKCEDNRGRDVWSTVLRIVRKPNRM